MNASRLLLLVLVAFISPSTRPVCAQSTRHILYGDVKVDDSKVSGTNPISFDLILYSETGMLIARQTVASNGRYRFNDLPEGRYDLVVEVETKEMARVRVDLTSPLISDLQRDLFLEWKPTGKPISKATVISAADSYARPPANEALFDRAREALDKKHYDQAAELLRKIVDSDRKDFQAWTELANTHFLQKDFVDAENEYLHAIDAHPGFFHALFSFGRLEITLKNYEVAIEALAKAVKARPESPDANYFLGEAYLQIKKGSLAVGYLNEAIRLDPQGMAEVHLRLALLYNGAGMKDKAAAEYEQFLKKKPNYPDRAKLEKYIVENKKQ
jgi:tetratricopeptide (TPR) repeat protein